MARRTAAAPAAPETEEVESAEETEASYWQKLIDKDPSDVQEAAREWFEERTGYELDPKTVQIVLSGYSRFQRSPENQERIATAKERAQAKAVEAEERRTERTAAGGVKRTATKATASAEAAPTRRVGRPAAKTAAPAVKRTSGRNRPARSAEELD